MGLYMFVDQKPKISSSLIQAIEDSVLFGHVQELSGVLDIAREDEEFPDDLRYALESLMYFRMNYGKGGPAEPITQADKQKATQMEMLWGREVIEMIGHHPDMTEAKYA